ncbi:MAG: gamma-glutamyltransferase, partial [Acinetobacter sp.]
MTVQAIDPVSLPQRGTIDDTRGYEALHHPQRFSGGLVVSQSRPASEIGAEILRAGGNAVDAAVAVGLAEAVTLPRAGNLGGGGYMLIHLAKQNKTIAIDYYSHSPAATTAKLLLDDQGKFDILKSISYQGVGVPGTVAGLYLAHQRYGKLKWQQVVQPAIDLAEKGVRLSDDEAMIVSWGSRYLKHDREASRIFYKADGSFYKAGEIFRQPDLAWSLKQIARDGADAFYRGEIAKRIVASSKANGGILSLKDFAAYQPRETEALWSSYRGVDLALTPPNSGGTTLAELLNILEQFPLAEYGQGSVHNLHLIAEATRLANHDCAHYDGGWPHYKTPAQGLTSKAFARERAALIQHNTIIPAGKLSNSTPLKYESTDTTHYSVADAEGNVVSNTYTLSFNF